MAWPTADELVKEFLDTHPDSHIIKIENFSLFQTYKFGRVESLVFDIGGYKWKLILYPNGDESNYGKDHISFYLQMQNAAPLPSNWKFTLNVRLFILNQFKKGWYTVDGYVELNPSRTGWGTAKFMSLGEFTYYIGGHLVNGCALLGVHLLDIKDSKRGTAESFTLVDRFQYNTFTWKIVRFSALDQLMYESEEFVVWDRKWRMQVYPRGSSDISDMLQVFLKAEGFVNNAPKAQTYARYTLRVLDKTKVKHVAVTYLGLFPADPRAYGANRLMPLKDLRNPSNYLVNDTLYLETEIHVMSQSKYI